MSNTPRTDAVVGQREYGSLQDSEYVRLARQLEQELAEAKANNAHLANQCKEMAAEAVLLRSELKGETK